MGFDNSFQLLLFLYSLIFGIVLGAVYTGLSALRLFKPPSSLLLFFSDSVYFLLSAVAFFVFTFVFCDGEIRLFVLLTVFIGWLCEYLTLGSLIKRFIKKKKKKTAGDVVLTLVLLLAVGVSHGFDSSMAELTRYRRMIRRKNKDNESLAIIFNDYMNCLWGDPTAEKEYPLIDAAAEAGCEYFCIDAGWYSAGIWWDNVGEWQESRERFPEGMKKVTDYIRSKGLIPGVWLEIEVMGINCPKAKNVPDDWFFMRHGKKVYDRSRYQLDFRNPEVVAHADEVIDRLVRDYGVGYIKMDYNIEPGIGTEINAESVGDGLLQHERAYLSWLDRVFERYPDLIIENCSSGGMRIDYAMLQRHSIQSTSDQDDYRMYATIAANSPTGLCPEQSAIWSYPLTEGDREEVVFNMVNAMLLRIHQSGHLVYISDERKALVKEALDCYKNIRGDIRTAVPFWCLGLSEFSDPWVSLGLKCENKLYLALWRRNSEKSGIVLDLAKYTDGKGGEAKLIYPSFGECEFEYNSELSRLTVNMPREYSARLFEIELD